MINQIEAEQIKKLIKKGFDIKLISFQLEIPIELLIKYSQEIEKENRPKVTEHNTYLEEARNNKIRENCRNELLKWAISSPSEYIKLFYKFSICKLLRG